MPALDFVTNVQLDDQKAFVLELSKFGAKVLNKPEQYISVDFRHNPTLTFAGTFDPAFLLTVISLDNINPEANEKYSKGFFDFFKEKLNIPGNRGYITFQDPGRALLGHQGTTFSTIFGK